jgi:formamidopyrimidine-DNA glycosylase
MPELPEVETIRRQLHEAIAGKTVQAVTVLKTGRETPLGKKFAQAVVGKRLAGVERRAKVLVFRFVDDTAILGHLKMTGRFLFVTADYEPNKHDRMLFVLSTGPLHLIWSDVRMFGYLRFAKPEEVTKQLAHYGPEPLESTPGQLADRLKRPSSRAIKATLLDQTVIAGVGNIYADEALFKAGIRPTRQTKSLSAVERLKLAKAIKVILQASVDRNGTSADDYVDTSGSKGDYKRFLKVYGYGGEPCKKCGTSIKKIRVAQRGTHYCPKCQA